MADLPPLPHDDLHTALGAEHPERSTVERLRAELAAAQPDRAAIEEHVGRLRSLPEVAASIATWWEDPATQRFINNLTNTGL
jgi:hypothetical protein